MSHAKIATKQAKYTLEQLHAGLAGKIRENRKEATYLAQAMRHVEASCLCLVMKFGQSPSAGGSLIPGSSEERSYATRSMRSAKLTTQSRPGRSPW